MKYDSEDYNSHLLYYTVQEWQSVVYTTAGQNCSEISSVIFPKGI